MTKKITFLHIDLAPYHNWVFQSLVKNGYNLKVYYYRTNYPVPEFLNSIMKFHRSSRGKFHILPKGTILVTAGYSVLPYFLSALVHKILGRGETIFTCDTILKKSKSHEFYKRFGKYIFPIAFDKCLAAGNKQKEFALILGFKKHQIKTGCYSTTIPEKQIHQKKSNQILFVGRLEHTKGILEFINWFITFPRMRDFKLYLIGYGSLKESIIKKIEGFENIIFIGKTDNNTVLKFMSESEMFVLPSIFEPWGVVIQEACLNGCYIVSSKNVGSSSFFIKGNGYIFEELSELDEVFNNFSSLSVDSKTNIQMESYDMGCKITPKLIAENIINENIH